MNTRHTRARVIRELQISATDKLLLSIRGYMLVTDLIIRGSKYFIILHSSGDIELYRSWNDECYGSITLSHAKRLIKINNQRS